MDNSIGNLMTVTTILGGVTNLIVGFVIGKMHERWEWNQLIKDGKIPKPVRVKVKR